MTHDRLSGLRVLVSGAGVAGPAVAYWLTRYGADTTVVEIAPRLRGGGFAVDFRGGTHLGVLGRMGVLDDLRAVQTHAGAMSFVDQDSTEIFRLPAEFAGGDLEVRRRDLSRILYEHTRDDAEYLFGDRIATAEEHAEGVDVRFASGTSRTFDVVVGADGMHSGVRRIAFGDERQYVRHLGYHLASWDLPDDLGTGPVPQHYNEPGRLASVSSDPDDPSLANAFVLFAGPRLAVDWQDVEQQKKTVSAALTGMRWHVPRLLASLDGTTELFFDAVSKVRMPRWHRGRFVLLGDAGYGVTLGGMGVGTSVVGAYVLAGELATAGGDHRTAFPAYQQRMRGYADRWQRGANPGQFLAPSTATRLRLRNWTFGSRLGRRLLVAGTKSLATTPALPEYAA